ncbi:MAG: hypothetical protein M3021_06075, partial [Actinomycetota bacterium]|nr:hypothetical protein [Actinomycetota bacterium]
RTVQLVQRCNAGGYSQYTVKIVLTNTAPTDAASSLPEYVTGGGALGVVPGNVATNVIVYGPPQARMEAPRVDGHPQPLGSFQQESRPVGVVRMELSPGQTKTVEMDVSKVVQAGAPVLDVTPTVQDIHDVILQEKKAHNCEAK